MNDQHKTLSRREFVTTATAVAAAAALVPPGAAAAGTSAGALRDYMQHDATGLAALVRRGEVSAAELLELAIARTEAVNGSINAVCLKHYDEARAALKSIDPNAPLAGVPFLLKDLGVYLKGTITSNGSRFFADRVATQTSTVVQRYQAAGLNIFGKIGFAGVRPDSQHRLDAVGQDTQPVESRVLRGRQLGWRGRGGGCGAYCRLHTPPTAAARSASRPRCADSSA
jgi:hypothetical protein